MYSKCLSNKVSLLPKVFAISGSHYHYNTSVNNNNKKQHADQQLLFRYWSLVCDFSWQIKYCINTSFRPERSEMFNI